jgi:hypothetical protein
MRIHRAGVLVPLLLAPASNLAQQVPQRDPQAVAALSSAIKALGGNPPADSVATGQVTLVAGSLTEAGTIRILTRGASQSLEDLQTSSTHRVVAYSNGFARQTDNSSSRPLQLELAVTSQSPLFPLPLLVGVLANPDFSFQYLGLESLDGAAAHHIRFWNTFASQPNLQHLAEFSARELWLDAATGLPLKLSYEQRAARGAAPRFPIDVFYSAYRNVGGVQYPFFIRKTFNGTPWATLAIQQVQFATGLTDANFPIR